MIAPLSHYYGAQPLWIILNAGMVTTQHIWNQSIGTLARLPPVWADHITTYQHPQTQPGQVDHPLVPCHHLCVPPPRVVSFFPGLSLCSSLLQELPHSFSVKSKLLHMAFQSLLPSSASILVSACHLPPKLQPSRATEILKTPHIRVYLQAFGVLFFLEYSFSLSLNLLIQTSHSWFLFGLKVSVCIWDHLLTAEGLVRNLLICPKPL